MSDSCLSLSKLKKHFLLVFAALVFVFPAANASSDAHEEEKFNPADLIFHHISDAHEWHFATTPSGHHITLYLPVILYSADRGLETFSSHVFHSEADPHQAAIYNGYTLDAKGHLISTEGRSFYDISITKNVVMLFLTAIMLVLVFSAVASGYKRNKGKAPKGIQSLMEPVIMFVRDEIVKPNLGHNTDKFLPYLLTLFFFILFGNLLGLLPGAGNLTGNIAVTLTLAVFTFIITNVSGNGAYWSHIFWTPGVPLPLRAVILPVEIIGIFTKPISLTVRLFVAITAGHIVLLSLICLAFVFKSFVVGGFSSLVVLFIYLIELLVAGIQAYVFTLFSSVYIGMAIADHHHDDH